MGKPQPRVRATAPKQADPRDGGNVPPPVVKNPLAPPGASEKDHDALANSTDGTGANKPVRERKKIEDLVSVTVPQRFNLTLDHGVVVEYAAGIQDMPKSHAEHWYAKANGVETNE